MHCGSWVREIEPLPLGQTDEFIASTKTMLPPQPQVIPPVTPQPVVPPPVSLVSAEPSEPASQPETEPDRAEPEPEPRTTESLRSLPPPPVVAPLAPVTPPLETPVVAVLAPVAPKPETASEGLTPDSEEPPAHDAKQKPARSWLIVLLPWVIGATLVGLLALYTSDDSSTPAKRISPTTTEAPLESAAGKPCVPVSEALPEGVSSLPVVTGPPPATVTKTDLVVGSGYPASSSSTVLVDLVVATCSDGLLHFSTYAAKMPMSVPVAAFIPGVAQGVAGMQVGGTRLIGVPSAEAFGAHGVPNEIAPDEALWVLVTLR